MDDNTTKIVDSAKDRLLEHFDSVRIFVTSHKGENDNTQAYTIGGGNFYTQYGQVLEWKARQDQQNREDVKKDNE